jgi:hypothetical protein
MFFDGAYPDFLPHCAGQRRVLVLYQGTTLLVP